MLMARLTLGLTGSDPAVVDRRPEHTVEPSIEATRHGHYTAFIPQQAAQYLYVLPP